MLVVSFQKRAQSKPKLSNAKWRFPGRDINIPLHFTNCLFWRVGGGKTRRKVGVTDDLLRAAESWQAAVLSNEMK